jgi:glutamate-ammonia-ligase adenylyltransferase
MFTQFRQSDQTSPSDSAVRLMQRLGFSDPIAAARDLATVCLSCKDDLPEDDEPPWFVSLTRVLREVPLKDQVLQTVRAFVASAQRSFDPFVLFEQSPRSLELLARLACGSPFLMQTVLAEPESLRTLLDESRTAEVKTREDFIRTVRGAVGELRSRPQRMAALRMVHHRELLRIGLCDAFGLFDLRYVTLQLSLLADAMVQICLEEAADSLGMSPEELAVIALGKHGGEELNYSSDIDLVIVADQASSRTQRLARMTVDGLSDSAPSGFLYRVDLRLRPWGQAGPLVSTVESYSDYLSTHAATWEKQALLKARCVAGSPEIGADFLVAIRPQLFTQHWEEARDSIRQMKARIEDRLRQRGRLESEVKLGVGSIRDVEFVVQYLQLVHGRSEPRVLRSNTLDALVRLTEFGVMESAWYQQLRAGYVFFRSVEHALQLLHNQQTHELPEDAEQREWLANRLDYPDAATLMKRFNEHRVTVRQIFVECIGDLSADTSSHGNVAAVDRPAAMPPPPTTGSGGSPPGGSSDAAQPVSGRRTARAAADVSDQLFQDIDQELVRDMLARLCDAQPIVVNGQPAADDEELIRLVICGREYAGWFSDVCGLLTLRDLDIRSGQTVADASRIVSTAHGQPPGTLTVLLVKQEGAGAWPVSSATCHRLAESFQSDIVQLATRVIAGQSEAARADLIESLCQRMRQHERSSSPAQVFNVQVSPIPNSEHTRVIVDGVDSPGVLFELANSFRVRRFRIRDARLESASTTFRNVLTITESDGSPIRSAGRRGELQSTITLIRRFMRWLPSAGEPNQALQRFRDLLDQMLPGEDWDQQAASLQRPEVLSVMAQLLGISPYFWEEFLRVRHAELLPVLEATACGTGSISRAELADELRSAVTASEHPSAAREAVNRFKDKHLFRIDLRFVLGRTRPFGTFSREVTDLAELVVLQMAELVYDELCRVHGHPVDEQQQPCSWTIAALGKFGGVEMGFASDIELMLIFSKHGRTSGKRQITNAAFFDLLIGQTAAGLAARHDGIFHVDLRMRPHGQAGSPAVSVNDFQTYYAVDGAAWPYERQSLVKLRCVGGDPELRQRVHAAVDASLYAGIPFDFPSMRAMRERQMRQLVRAGRINAKLSDGGLVDCEYAVQALQLSFGHRHAALRSTSTLQALDAAALLGLVAPDQHAAVRETYIFLRDLIDCLRLERGLARDLTLPRDDSRTYRRLMHRLKLVQSNAVPLDELPQRLQLIRQFSFDVQHHCRNLRSLSDFASLPEPSA